MTVKKYGSQSGTVIVEAAMTLLLLFIFLLGIMEAGRFMNVQEVLTNAAREGARMAVAPLTQTTTLPTTSDIQSNVQTFLSAANITNATVTPSTYTDATGVKYTRVIVTAPYKLITFSMFSNLQVTLEGQALMRNETSPY